VRAIERAEQVVASGQESDWEPFRKIIEVIQMQTRKDWMKKYYTEAQLADLGNAGRRKCKRNRSGMGGAGSGHGRGNCPWRRPFGCGRSGTGCAAEGVAAAIYWRRSGDGKNLQKLYTDRSNWPENFKKPFSDAVDKFLCQAAEELAKVS